jgi:hypothetical protein
MPITYHDVEEKVIEACYGLAEQEFPNTRATARTPRSPIASMDHAIRQLYRKRRRK